jgi:hypothetical protein
MSRQQHASQLPACIPMNTPGGQQLAMESITIGTIIWVIILIREIRLLVKPLTQD